MSRAPDTWILTADCPSLLGTVDAVTRYLFEHRCYVTEHHSFDDQRSGRFLFALNSASPRALTRTPFAKGWLSGARPSA